MRNSTMDSNKTKCHWPEGMTIDILGHEVDPCIYEEIETHHFVTVHVLKCKKCGHIDISWEPSYDEYETYE